MFLNDKIPHYLTGKYQLIGTVTFSVLFAIVFLNIYIPYSETAWFGLADSETFIRTVLFISTSLILLIFSRILMYRTKKEINITYWMYILWAVLEIVAISCIYLIFTADMPSHRHEPDWRIFTRVLPYSTISLGIPYIIAGMYFAIIDKNNTIRLMNYENVVTDEPEKPKEQLKKITLFDNSGALKLSLNLDNLYYIESDDN